MSGRLFYVIGASGVGKDSLMRYAREQLADTKVMFAHRYITRPPELQGENHIALSEAEFAVRLQNHCFVMHWDSHGYRYGIGAEIKQWLAQGLNVVVNGSRAYYPEALQRFPQMQGVFIAVSPQRLKERLQLRGRESEAEIAARLQRAAEYENIACDKLITINNDGPLQDAGEALVKLFQEGVAS